MYGFNRIKAIKKVRAHIRRHFEPLIDEANPDSQYINVTKDEMAKIIDKATGLKVTKDLVDSFAEEYVPFCDNCKVIRRWHDVGGDEMVLTISGKVLNQYGEVCKSFDQTTMDLILKLISEKEEIISAGIPKY